MISFVKFHYDCPIVVNDKNRVESITITEYIILMEYSRNKDRRVVQIPYLSENTPILYLSWFIT